MALIFDCSVREHPTIVRLVHQRRAVIMSSPGEAIAGMWRFNLDGYLCLRLYS